VRLRTRFFKLKCDHLISRSEIVIRVAVSPFVFPFTTFDGYIRWIIRACAFADSGSPTKCNIIAVRTIVAVCIVNVPRTLC
jgi:hypothetical protein